MLNPISYQMFDDVTEWPIAFQPWEIEAQLADIINDNYWKI